jgi:hypothetical protein
VKLLRLSFIVLAFSFSFSAISLVVSENSLVNFGELTPGQSEYDGGYTSYPSTVLEVNVSPSATWELDVNATSFVGPDSMDIGSLKWHMVYAGESLSYGPDWWVDLCGGSSSDAIPNCQSQVAFTGSSQSFRSATSARTKGVYNIIWHINIPESQMAGDYYSNVTFTLTTP